MNSRWDYRTQPLALALAALALVAFGYLLHGFASVPAMGLLHIVAFKLADARHLPSLTSDMLALKERCTLKGKPYIRSVVGGKQSSPEGKDGGMQVVFLLEFENQADADYYIFDDPAHTAFKDAIGALGVEGVTVLDFVPGVF
ncbi:hypothetical protein CspeluHIS016_0703720 [Cutaneotrichosporon spelunceum]|uniref:Stress-response A/B barrel domain-containing protein n=1 Tax=Cutaneotrichosporon spelunceum TaxID=1672016 RepID=A0AAD3TYS1_9TREE|nr:hypothetical protein CspeluHIS016_0703720 [Cutaneotrichosporon spelunceum]